MRLRLFRDKDGEPRVWSHSINYSKRDKGGIWAKHGAWFLNWPGNEFHLEWNIFRKRLGFTIQFSGDGDHALMIAIAIPFIISLWLGFRNCDWLLKLTGTQWYKGKSMEDWEREIGFQVFDGALVIYPWINPMNYPTHGRDIIFFRPDNFLLGRQKYSKYNERSFDVVLAMPEGTYTAKVTLYTAEWKRPRWPRWPLTRRINRANVEVEGGVPIPGKGENSWDMDDDAIYSIGTPAESVDEALEQFRESALRDRKKYAGEGWVPDVGWPAHMEAR